MAGFVEIIWSARRVSGGKNEPICHRRGSWGGWGATSYNEVCEMDVNDAIGKSNPINAA